MTDREKLEFIEDNYLTMPIKTIGRKIGHSYTYVKKRLDDNGWVIPREVLEKRRQGAFVKGHIPHNKGRRITEYMPPEKIANIKKTQFKKGNKSHNTKEGAGHIVTRIDNTGIPYKYIKIADADWQLLSRVVWENHNGKLNTKDIITFKDGNSLNCKLENLEKITRSEHVRRNSYNRLDTWDKPMAKRAILSQIRKNNELK